MHSKTHEVLYRHSPLRQGQHVNDTLCAEHIKNVQVVQKGVYTLNCFLSEKLHNLNKEMYNVVVCITATITITTTYLARVLCTADETYMAR